MWKHSFQPCSVDPNRLGTYLNVGKNKREPRQKLTGKDEQREIDKERLRTRSSKIHSATKFSVRRQCKTEKTFRRNDQIQKGGWSKRTTNILKKFLSLSNLSDFYSKNWPSFWRKTKENRKETTRRNVGENERSKGKPFRSNGHFHFDWL